ncbi:Phosphotransferase [Yamadazyma tenuis]|uniref:diacylglycerol cholinephosphotransferase n=1 Tax=Candida tenuis (strain ATCC 10573 / BCRC 21748 / CBS 615 / JCM 9827 / NBRC 10315 / NRRL Y-1498 / VKM Y-70) TaxID=590646 RepID=G3AXR1_CANTC|nr:Choline/ethanolaminephosphotransferase [Yamadazyma tenuis ATCC 10573]EGV65674.1 Choline/ethanolaminephosphotransferase [Yamadazyma tenuis ATCC 10573]WEJ96012.1 Phosphotransferase [Yamadazyma tenuis]
MGFYIPQDKLPNLKLYKYSSEDHSTISRLVLKPWWNWFVQLFPRSMAPNVITLLGLVFIICNLFSVFYYDPYLNQDSPRWCYFFYAFGLFMYQTFDGCDGCHARNTGQSGPLGELFDHSIDAINTTLGSIVFCSVLQTGYSKLFLLTQFASVTNFYMSTWEEYHTHTLFLSTFSGPVEGILMIIGMFAIIGVFGPGIFQYKLLAVNNSWVVFDVDVKTAASLLGLGSLYFNIAQAFGNVARYYRRSKDSVAASKAIDMAYQGLIPFFSYYTSIAMLVTVFPDYLYQFGLPLSLSIGLSIAFAVGRIILAHLTIQSFPMVHLPMIVPVVQLVTTKFCVDVYGYDLFDVVYSSAWLGFGVTLGIHGSFINEIIYEITTYLDIYALSIKHKKA